MYNNKRDRNFIEEVETEERKNRFVGLIDLENLSKMFPWMPINIPSITNESYMTWYKIVQNLHILVYSKIFFDNETLSKMTKQEKMDNNVEGTKKKPDFVLGNRIIEFTTSIGVSNEIIRVQKVSEKMKDLDILVKKGYDVSAHCVFINYDDLVNMDDITKKYVFEATSKFLELHSKLKKSGELKQIYSKMKDEGYQPEENLTGISEMCELLESVFIQKSKLYDFYNNINIKEIDADKLMDEIIVNSEKTETFLNNKYCSTKDLISLIPEDTKYNIRVAIGADKFANEIFFGGENGSNQGLSFNHFCFTPGKKFLKPISYKDIINKEDIFSINLSKFLQIQEEKPKIFSDLIEINRRIEITKKEKINRKYFIKLNEVRNRRKIGQKQNKELDQKMNYKKDKLSKEEVEYIELIKNLNNDELEEENDYLTEKTNNIKSSTGETIKELEESIKAIQKEVFIMTSLRMNRSGNFEFEQNEEMKKSRVTKQSKKDIINPLQTSFLDDKFMDLRPQKNCDNSKFVGMNIAMDTQVEGVLSDSSDYNNPYSNEHLNKISNMLDKDSEKIWFEVLKSKGSSFVYTIVQIMRGIVMSSASFKSKNNNDLLIRILPNGTILCFTQAKGLEQTGLVYLVYSVDDSIVELYDKYLKEEYANIRKILFDNFNNTKDGLGIMTLGTMKTELGKQMVKNGNELFYKRCNKFLKEFNTDEFKLKKVLLFFGGSKIISRNNGVTICKTTGIKLIKDIVESADAVLGSFIGMSTYLSSCGANYYKNNLFVSCFSIYHRQLILIKEIEYKIMKLKLDSGTFGRSKIAQQFEDFRRTSPIQVEIVNNMKLNMSKFYNDSKDLMNNGKHNSTIEDPIYRGVMLDKDTLTDSSYLKSMGRKKDGTNNKTMLRQFIEAEAEQTLISKTSESNESNAIPYFNVTPKEWNELTYGGTDLSKVTYFSKIIMKRAYTIGRKAKESAIVDWRRTAESPALATASTKKTQSTQFVNTRGKDPKKMKSNIEKVTQEFLQSDLLNDNMVILLNKLKKTDLFNNYVDNISKFEDLLKSRENDIKKEKDKKNKDESKHENEVPNKDENSKTNKAKGIEVDFETIFNNSKIEEKTRQSIWGGGYDFLIPNTFRSQKEIYNFAKIKDEEGKGDVSRMVMLEISKVIYMLKDFLPEFVIETLKKRFDKHENVNEQLSIFIEMFLSTILQKEGQIYSSIFMTEAKKELLKNNIEIKNERRLPKGNFEVLVGVPTRDGIILDIKDISSVLGEGGIKITNKNFKTLMEKYNILGDLNCELYKLALWEYVLYPNLNILTIVEKAQIGLKKRAFFMQIISSRNFGVLLDNSVRPILKHILENDMFEIKGNMKYLKYQNVLKKYHRKSMMVSIDMEKYGDMMPIVVFLICIVALQHAEYYTESEGKMFYSLMMTVMKRYMLLPDKTAEAWKKYMSNESVDVKDYKWLKSFVEKTKNLINGMAFVNDEGFAEGYTQNPGFVKDIGFVLGVFNGFGSFLSCILGDEVKRALLRICDFDVMDMFCQSDDSWYIFMFEPPTHKYFRINYVVELYNFIKNGGQLQYKNGYFFIKRKENDIKSFIYRIISVNMIIDNKNLLEDKFLKEREEVTNFINKIFSMQNTNDTMFISGKALGKLALHIIHLCAKACGQNPGLHKFSFGYSGEMLQLSLTHRGVHVPKVRYSPIGAGNDGKSPQTTTMSEMGSIYNMITSGASEVTVSCMIKAINWYVSDIYALHHVQRDTSLPISQLGLYWTIPAYLLYYSIKANMVRLCSITNPRTKEMMTLWFNEPEIWSINEDTKDRNHINVVIGRNNESDNPSLMEIGIDFQVSIQNQSEKVNKIYVTLKNKSENDIVNVIDYINTLYETKIDPLLFKDEDDLIKYLCSFQVISRTTNDSSFRAIRALGSYLSKNNSSINSEVKPGLLMRLRKSYLKMRVENQFSVELKKKGDIFNYKEYELGTIIMVFQNQENRKKMFELLPVNSKHSFFMLKSLLFNDIVRMNSNDLILKVITNDGNLTFNQNKQVFKQIKSLTSIFVKESSILPTIRVTYDMIHKYNKGDTTINVEKMDLTSYYWGIRNNKNFKESCQYLFEFLKSMGVTTTSMDNRLKILIMYLQANMFEGCAKLTNQTLDPFVDRLQNFYKYDMEGIIHNYNSETRMVKENNSQDIEMAANLIGIEPIRQEESPELMVNVIMTTLWMVSFLFKFNREMGKMIINVEVDKYSENISTFMRKVEFINRTGKIIKFVPDILHGTNNLKNKIFSNDVDLIMAIDLYNNYVTNSGVIQFMVNFQTGSNVFGVCVKTNPIVLGLTKGEEPYLILMKYKSNNEGTNWLIITNLLNKLVIESLGTIILNNFYLIEEELREIRNNKTGFIDYFRLRKEDNYNISNDASLFNNDTIDLSSSNAGTKLKLIYNKSENLRITNHKAEITFKVKQQFKKHDTDWITNTMETSEKIIQKISLKTSDMDERFFEKIKTFSNFVDGKQQYECLEYQLTGQEKIKKTLFYGELKEQSEGEILTLTIKIDLNVSVISGCSYVIEESDEILEISSRRISEINGTRIMYVMQPWCSEQYTPLHSKIGNTVIYSDLTFKLKEENLEEYVIPFQTTSERLEGKMLNHIKTRKMGLKKVVLQKIIKILRLDRNELKILGSINDIAIIEDITGFTMFSLIIMLYCIGDYILTKEDRSEAENNYINEFLVEEDMFYSEVYIGSQIVSENIRYKENLIEQGSEIMEYLFTMDAEVTRIDEEILKDFIYEQRRDNMNETYWDEFVYLNEIVDIKENVLEFVSKNKNFNDSKNTILENVEDEEVLGNGDKNTEDALLTIEKLIQESKGSIPENENKDMKKEESQSNSSSDKSSETSYIDLLNNLIVEEKEKEDKTRKGNLLIYKNEEPRYQTLKFNTGYNAKDLERIDEIKKDERKDLKNESTRRKREEIDTPSILVSFEKTEKHMPLPRMMVGPNDDKEAIDIIEQMIFAEKEMYGMRKKEKEILTYPGNEERETKELEEIREKMEKNEENSRKLWSDDYYEEKVDVELEEEKPYYQMGLEQEEKNKIRELWKSKYTVVLYKKINVTYKQKIKDINTNKFIDKLFTTVRTDKTVKIIKKMKVVNERFENKPILNYIIKLLESIGHEKVSRILRHISGISSNRIALSKNALINISQYVHPSMAILLFNIISYY
jgi:hypothetical protein